MSTPTKAPSGTLDRVFHLSERHTDVKTEIIAGVTTFMTMAYILAVNPDILSASGKAESETASSAVQAVSSHADSRSAAVQSSGGERGVCQG